MKKNKWIKVKVETDPQNIFIRVVDSGKGVPPELRKKIMEPFYTTKSESHGTGLGLSISRQIIDQHGGELYYEDAAYTTFTIRLPLPKEEKVAA